MEQPIAYSELQPIPSLVMPSELPSSNEPEPEPEPDGSDITGEEFLHYGVRLYRAALRGDELTVRSIGLQSTYWICASITKGGETALHIAAAAKHVSIVKLLIFMSPNCLVQVNKVGNTPLCFAAVSGVVEIARLMVDNNKELPNIRGSQGMTPLHMAVLLGHRQMVWYLLEVTDDGQLTDQDRVGILTSSIDTDMFDVALHILSKHRNLALLRDSKKETALHALARKPLKLAHRESSIWNRLPIQWSEANENKRVKLGMELQLVESVWNEIIKQREQDISNLIGYPWRVIFVAAGRVIFVAAELGKAEFLKTMIHSYPDLIWKVDENRRTIFHVAVMHRHEEIFKIIYDIGAIKDLIATYKDYHGNNMLHLAGKLASLDRLNSVSGAALQMQQEILWFKEVKNIVRPEYAENKNDDHKTPHALFSEEHETLRVKGEEWMKKTAESCALVATLITTVVFSAAFQLPGGVNNTGETNLQKMTLFVVFTISNAISLFTSTASVLMFLSILTSRYAERDFLTSLPLKLMSGLILLLVSIAIMIVAFTATFFITFRKAAKWVPIPIALIATIPITLFALQQYPLLIDTYRSTYKSNHSLFQSCNPKLFEISSWTEFPASPMKTIFKQAARRAQSDHLAVSPAAASPPKLSIYLHRATPSLIVDPTASQPNSATASNHQYQIPTINGLLK